MTYPNYLRRHSIFYAFIVGWGVAGVRLWISASGGEGGSLPKALIIRQKHLEARCSACNYDETERV